MKTIWNKQTGEGRAYESVDAREILESNPDLYTDVDPNPPKDGEEGADGTGPQNVGNVENEFRREPVGDDVPAPEREGVIIRNPITDQPRMAPPPDAASASVPDANLDDMTVAQLKDHAAAKNIDLDGATTKADIRAAIDKAKA